MTEPGVAAEADARGVSRLVHFTPGRTFTTILRDGHIRSRRDVDTRSPEDSAPTDQRRLDGHPDKICCSVEYPNAFYFTTVVNRAEHRNFLGWVCLLLDREPMTRRGVLFSPVNAAKGRGCRLRPGRAGLAACYDTNVDGWRRAPEHLRSAPTDVQAEVLVPGPIAVSLVRGVVVDTPEAAENLIVTARMLGLADRATRFPWFVAPDMFDGRRLSAAIRRGDRVGEEPWSRAVPA